MSLNTPVSQEINNNSRIQLGGLQFIPSRLNTGELALIMPNSGTLPCFPLGALPEKQNCKNKGFFFYRGGTSRMVEISKFPCMGELH